MVDDLRSKTAIELHDAALTLENEGAFFEAYKKTSPNAYERRELIKQWLQHRHIRLGNKYDREQLRMYFDDIWSLNKCSRNELGEVVLEFWKDEVKYPATKHGAPLAAETVAKMFEATPVPSPTSTKEDSMLTIQTKTYVNGNEIDKLTDGQLFEMIAGQEREMKEMEAIINKPKKLVAELVKRQAGIDALVAFLDAKPAV